MTPDQFSPFIRDPKTTAMLDDMVRDNRRIDAQLAGVPASRSCQFCDQLAWFVQVGVAAVVYRCDNGHAAAVSR